MSSLRTFLRLLVTLGLAAIVTVAAWVLFIDYPTSLTDLFGVVFAVVAVLAGLQLGNRMAGSAFPDYNVAEVAVSGPITRDGGRTGRLPRGPTSPGADDIVEQIDRADEDDNVEALLVKLNTPGGEIVPSEDIRVAAAEFDGPTIGYTNDTCASGGMWIASGCDELWARDGSLVGSIGVRLAQLRVHELAEEYGIDYESFSSGEYKETFSNPFGELDDDEREYLQALSDAWYEHFVERVAEGRALEAETVRDTEARVYLGEEAQELGLVDRIGDRDAIEDALEAELATSVTVEEFEPQKGLSDRLRGGAEGLAYAFGAGIAGALTGGDMETVQLR